MTARQIQRIREQLGDYFKEFAGEFGRNERRRWCGKYLEGLLQEGERKSIKPLAARVGGDDQAWQQFVNQSPWDHDAVMFRLRSLMRRPAAEGGVLVLDDTSLSKQHRHSVGVARQHCGALGKIANCQSIVTWQWAGARGHWPLATRLYLPAEWTEDPARMAGAGVPPDRQGCREKWRIALELLDEMKPQLPAYQALVFDAGYGGILPLLTGLEKRAGPCVAQVPGNIAAWPIDAVASLAQAKRGRPAKHAKVQPLTVTEWRDRSLPEPSAWREVELLRADGAGVRAVAVSVQASQRAGRWRQPGTARWLLIEQLGDGTFKYHLSSFPADTSLEALVRLAHQRWAVEQNYQRLKEQPGLDHFEGRS